MKRIMALCLVLTVSALGENESRLSPASGRFLGSFTALRPGMTEKQVRARFPELGEIIESIDPWTEKTHRADLPVFFLGGVSWEAEFYFHEGKLRGARLWAINRNPDAAPGENIILQRADGRRLKATLMRHLDARLGARPEMHVPVLECPAGNPYFLMKYWPAAKHIVAVNYEGMDGTANVTVSVWDKSYWTAQNKKEFEDLWPLKPE